MGIGDKFRQAKQLLDLQKQAKKIQKELKDLEIIESKRIGIEYSEEAQDYLWRYYIKENPFVSIK